MAVMKKPKASVLIVEDDPAILSGLKDVLVFNGYRPVGVDRTIWHSTQYFPKAKTAGQRFNQEYGHVLFRDIILEDGRTLENTQTMLATGAKENFFLQDEEILIRHSHYVVDQMINGRPAGTAATDGRKAAYG